MSKQIVTSDRALTDHDLYWKRKLEGDDFRKMGVESWDEFFRLCELRRKRIPESRKTDYRWLHYLRAEYLKRWSPEDNCALLTAAKSK